MMSTQIGASFDDELLGRVDVCRREMTRPAFVRALVKAALDRGGGGWVHDFFDDDEPITLEPSDPDDPKLLVNVLADEPLRQEIESLKAEIADRDAEMQDLRARLAVAEAPVLPRQLPIHLNEGASIDRVIDLKGETVDLDPPFVVPATGSYYFVDGSFERMPETGFALPPPPAGGRLHEALPHDEPPWFGGPEPVDLLGGDNPHMFP